MRFLYSTLGLLLISSLVFGQSGREYRRYNIMGGNQIYTVFGNWGVIGQPAEHGSRGAWKYKENGYIGDFSIMIGAKVNYSDTNFVSMETCPVDRPVRSHELSPSGKYWGFEPLSGYFNANQPGVALYTDPETWPPFWPDKLDDLADPGWPGSWNGYFGKTSIASEECYFVMDDNNDEEFNYSKYNQWSVEFKPDSLNLLRNGLGLRVESRYIQFNLASFEDVLLMEHTIINEGTTSYSQVVFGGLMGTYVGVTSTDHSHNDYDDDACFFDIVSNSTFFWDFDMDVKSNPLWKSDVGVAAVALIQSPGNPLDGIDNDRDNANSPESSAPYFTADDFQSSRIEVGDSIVLIDENFSRSIVTIPDQSSFTIKTCGQTFTIVPGETFVQEGNPDNPNAYDSIDNDFDGLIDENYFLHYDFDTYNLIEPFSIDNTLGPTQYIDYVSGQGLNDPLIDEVGNNVDEVGLTAFYYFAPSSIISFADDEKLWHQLTPGLFEPPYSYDNGYLLSGEDGDYLFGTGYFPLFSNEQQKVLLGLVFAETPEALQAKIVILNSMNFNIQAKPNLTLTAPVSGEYAGSSIKIAWDSDEPEGIVIIEYTSDNGRSWEFVDNVAASLGNYTWDISKISDSILNKILLRHSYKPFEASFSELFTINNPGEAVPQVIFTESPEYGETVTGDLKVSWLAGDADGDVVMISLFYSTTNNPVDTVWHFLTSFAESGSYIIKTGQLPNSQSVLLKLVITDGTNMNFDLGKQFIISNTYSVLPDSLQQHVAGNGNGRFEVHIVDVSSLTGHQYKVTFNTDGEPKSYNVQDQNTGEYVLTNCTQLDSSAESPTFDGIRLLIHDIFPARADYEGSYWSNPSKAYSFVLNILDTYFEPDPGHLLGLPHPSDYKIEFSDEIVDTSLTIEKYWVYGVPVNFRIYNVTDARFIDFIFIDTDFNQILSPTDEIIFFETVSETQKTFTWDLFFLYAESTYSHGSGDTLFIKTLKPFSNEDCFVFSTDDQFIGVNQTSQNPIMFELAQNYPNPFNPITTITFSLPKTSNVSLKVYNILGEEVKTLVNRKQITGSYEIRWDGKNEDGTQVSTGVYLYRIKAGNYISVKKMVYIK